jgi:hypothetical protein
MTQSPSSPPYGPPYGAPPAPPPQPPPDPPSKVWIALAKRLGLIIGGVVLLGIIVQATNGTRSTPATPSAGASAARTVEAAPLTTFRAPTEAAPVGPLSTFSDGVYEVGRDIHAGSYVAPGAQGPSCYWERATDPSAGLDAIIANDRTRGGQVLISVKAGEFLKVDGCGTWTKR